MSIQHYVNTMYRVKSRINMIKERLLTYFILKFDHFYVRKLCNGLN